MTPLQQQFSGKFGDIVKIDEPLSSHTTYKIGGNAEVFVMPKDNNQLIDLLKYVVDENIPYLIIGGGSNILIPDEGVSSVVIKPSNAYINIEGEKVVAGAGAVLAVVASQTAKAGLTGLEWGVGVPGNIGGAVRGNVGCFGSEIKDTLIEAKVFDGKDVIIMKNGDLDFTYRTSRIKNNGGKEVVLEATFKLNSGKPEIAEQKIKDYLKKKFDSQPFGEPTAGCVFKNIELDKLESIPTDKFNVDIESDHPEFKEKGIVPAAWLIDKAGLKGYKKDGIKVSEKHANFLVNTGEGSEKALKAVVAHIKATVKKMYGVDLVEEVEFV